MKNKQEKVIIGIDPGITNLGLCIKHPSSKSELHATWPFMKFLAWLNIEIDKIGGAIIENPNLDSNIFSANHLPEKFARQNCINDIRSELRTQLKIAQNVGENKAIAKIIISIFEQCKVPYAEVAPSDRERVTKEMTNPEVRFLKCPTKTKLNQYKLLTDCRINGITSCHSRDAGTLLIGRSLAWIQRQDQLRKDSIQDHSKKILKFTSQGRH